MTVRARLYDARGDDRDVDLTSDEVQRVDDRRLLWVDVDERADADLSRLAEVLDLEPRLARQLRADRGQARLIRSPTRILITLGTLEREGEEINRGELDVVVGRNLVVTVHDGPMSAIGDFEEQLKGDSELGQLEAGAFMTGLVDAVLGAYFREIDLIERDIEALDQMALRSGGRNYFLSKVVDVRHRIAIIRRALTPNRDALSPIVRPDFEVHEDLVRAWPGTLDRLERAIDGADRLRDLLVGSVDIYLGRSAQRSNDVMKALTVLSAIALPAIVLAGVMGMNFKLSFFDNAQNFWIVIGAMGMLAVGILGFSHWRRWI
jgi:magnesium transporter